MAIHLLAKTVSMHRLKFFTFFLFLFSKLTCSTPDYEFDGYYSNYTNAGINIISLSLPYNPIVIAYNSHDSQMSERCAKQWPKGEFHQGNGMGKIPPCDFLWIDDEGNELQILKRLDNYHEPKVIYTSTTFRIKEYHYEILKKYLESRGFVLYSHWYREGERGYAIFLRKDIYDMVIRSLNYSPEGKIQSVAIESSDGIERFFKKAEDKENLPKFQEVDFIYMINLDERPEKFTLTNKDLNSHGIYPYRFSAVNGWQLPLNTIRQIGVPFSCKMTNEQLMGTIYKEVDGDEYISNELIDQEGETYFALGQTRGVIGIVLSHLSVLQDAYDSGYQTIWVMEDDVEVLDRPEQIPQLIQQLDQLDKEWDILFTDPDTKDPEGQYVPCRALAARPNFNQNPLSYFLKNFYPVSQELSRTGMRYGAYSMVLRRSGIKKILDYFKSYQIFLPYDIDYWLIPDLRMYCPNQAIISHRPGSLSDNFQPSYAEKKEP